MRRLARLRVGVEKAVLLPKGIPTGLSGFRVVLLGEFGGHGDRLFSIDDLLFSVSDRKDSECLPSGLLAVNARFPLGRG